ncbi:MAG TPA: hypothetical protein VGO00_22280, partial [Kofleriaceae bacterium]|nr:hypothetical protein [Kofleriaceae bacterium]
MVNGPPCAQCGWTLRWIPEQNAWGCDRCRQMFPVAPQPQVAPPPAFAPPQPPPGSPYAPGSQVQQPYSPYAGQGHAAPAMAPPMRAPGTKSKLGLFIGLGAVVVGGAVLAIVLVMRGGKGGGGSRDGVINDAFAALSAGDGDKLVKLGDFATVVSQVIECKDSDDDQD